MEKDEFRKQLIKKLNELNTKIDALIEILAVSPKMETILKDKTKTQQIEILSDLGFPKEAIALIVDTTLETVSVRISEIRKKRGERKKKRREEIGENTKRNT